MFKKVIGIFALLGLLLLGCDPGSDDGEASCASDADCNGTGICDGVTRACVGVGLGEAQSANRNGDGQGGETDAVDSPRGSPDSTAARGDEAMDTGDGQTMGQGDGSDFTPGATSPAGDPETDDASDPDGENTPEASGPDAEGPADEPPEDEETMEDVPHADGPTLNAVCTALCAHSPVFDVSAVDCMVTSITESHPGTSGNPDCVAATQSRASCERCYGDEGVTVASCFRALNQCFGEDTPDVVDEPRIPEDAPVDDQLTGIGCSDICALAPYGFGQRTCIEDVVATEHPEVDEVSTCSLVNTGRSICMQCYNMAEVSDTTCRSAVTACDLEL